MNVLALSLFQLYHSCAPPGVMKSFSLVLPLWVRVRVDGIKVKMVARRFTIFFLESLAESNGACNGLKKPFQQTFGIDRTCMLRSLIFNFVIAFSAKRSKRLKTESPARAVSRAVTSYSRA